MNTNKILFLLVLFMLSFSHQVRSQNAEIYLKRGNQNFQQQKFLEAIQDYKKAIALKPEFAKAYHNLGNVQYLLQDYKNALPNFDKAIALSPQDFEPYQTRGAVYIALRQYNDARKDLDKAINLNDKSAIAFFNRAELNLLTKQPSKACEDWQKASKLGYTEAKAKLKIYCNEKNSTSTDTLQSANNKLISTKDYLKSAEIKLELRDYDAAINHFSKAIELDAKSHQAYFGRGTSHLAKGNTLEACKDLHQAEKLGNPNAKEMIANICH